jgi:hypothetical protein
MRLINDRPGPIGRKGKQGQKGKGSDHFCRFNSL